MKVMAGSVCPMQDMEVTCMELRVCSNSQVQNIKVQIERDVQGSDKGRNHH